MNEAEIRNEIARLIASAAEPIVARVNAFPDDHDGVSITVPLGELRALRAALDLMPRAAIIAAKYAA